MTLWEQAGRKARRLQPGQYVLLTGLSTSSVEQSGPNSTWFVNGSAVCGTDIYNSKYKLDFHLGALDNTVTVSTMKALLTSNSLRQITPLQKIENPGSWQTNVTVVGWKLRADTLSDKEEGEEWQDGSTMPADIITTDARTYKVNLKRVLVA